MTTTTSVGESFADKIILDTHPSDAELGAITTGFGVDKGRREWSNRKLTRLVLPVGAINYWIDYDNYDEARDAMSRARACLKSCETVEDVVETIQAFYAAE